MYLQFSFVRTPDNWIYVLTQITWEDLVENHVSIKSSNLLFLNRITVIGSEDEHIFFYSGLTIHPSPIFIQINVYVHIHMYTSMHTYLIYTV